MSHRELLTAEELARRLRVKPRTIRQWSRSGRIPAIRLSPKVVRYELEAVVNAMITRRCKSDQTEMRSDT